MASPRGYASLEHDTIMADLLSVVGVLYQATKGKPGQGEAPCPICRGGVLRFSVLGRQSVIVACTTDSCVRITS
jgi:hypothetical protein